MWLWMLGFAFAGMVAGIVFWTVIRSDANDILRLLVDSYNQDRGFNANPEEDEDDDENSGGY